MRIGMKHLLAGLAVACLANTAAAASSTLDNLVAGGTLSSDNGKLTFSNFTFLNTSSSGDVSASGINVLSRDSGLLFAPSIALPQGQSRDFLITYDVTAADSCSIVGAGMSTTAAVSGEGFVATAEVLTGGASENLLNLFTSQQTIADASVGFEGTSALSIRNNFGVTGPAFLSDVEQTFDVVCEDTPTTNVVPTPTAALAGLALLGLVGVRRRRSE